MPLLMGARGVAWRRLCPDEVSRRLDEASRVTLYILHQTGPTGFILKEDGSRKKIKVFLGDPHRCSCADFKKTQELCHHILWVMLKKFRIPRSNAVIWQLGLVEREISEILRGYLRRQSPTPSRNHTPSSLQIQIPQREIGPDDVCPICQDDLMGSGRRLTYCRFGCGKSVHVKCMKIWSDHQKSADDATLRCPLCREDFGSIVDLSETRFSRLTGSDQQQQQQQQHLGVECAQCSVCPVVGRLYRCRRCASYHLCHSCFSANQGHRMHPFEFRQHCSQPWRPVPHPSSAPSHAPSSLPPTLITSLQSRSLTESDYNLLLALDCPQNQGSRPSRPPREDAMERDPREGVAERVIASLRVEPLDGNHPLVVGGATCQLCARGYVRGDWVKKLPCKHKFHRACIDDWLFSAHTTCPVDHRPICAHRQTHKHTSGQSSSSSGQRRVTGSLTRAGLLKEVRSHNRQSPQNVQFGVWGQGIRSETSLLGAGKATPIGKAAPTRLKRCLRTSTTLDVTSTHPLSGGGINSMATSSLEPHPLQEAEATPSFKRLQLGGQRAWQHGVGMASQKPSPVGCLRRGSMAGDNSRNKELAGTNGGHHAPQPHLPIPHVSTLFM